MINIDEAACTTEDPGLFFPDAGKGYAAKVKEAKRICGTCPIESKCLAEAIKNNEEYGIWGGTTEKERKQLILRIK